MSSASDLRYSFLIAIACVSVRCADVETGYVFGAEVPADLGAMYGQIGQSSSCLNGFPQDSYRCELFKYIPCERTVEPRQVVASDVPVSCRESYHWSTAQIGEGSWCLIGPNVEPSRPAGMGQDEWCAGVSWMESEFHSGSCDDGDALVSDFRTLIDSGELDLDAECYPVSPVQVFEACISFMCNSNELVAP